jgi:hypothetical protein
LSSLSGTLEVVVEAHGCLLLKMIAEEEERKSVMRQWLAPRTAPQIVRCQTRAGPRTCIH